METPTRLRTYSVFGRIRHVGDSPCEPGVLVEHPRRVWYPRLGSRPQESRRKSNQKSPKSKEESLVEEVLRPRRPETGEGRDFDYRSTGRSLVKETDLKF